MPTIGRRRLTSDQLAMCREVLVGVEDMQGYEPRNEANTVASLVALIEQMDAARRNEMSLEHAVEAARFKALEAEWVAYQTALDVRREVQVQFGRESSQAKAVGFKRPSERKKPVRKKKDGSDKTKSNGSSAGSANGSSPSSATSGSSTVSNSSGSNGSSAAS